VGGVAGGGGGGGGVLVGGGGVGGIEREMECERERRRASDGVRERWRER